MSDKENQSSGDPGNPGIDSNANDAESVNGSSTSASVASLAVSSSGNNGNSGNNNNKKKGGATKRAQHTDKPSANWCFTWNNPPKDYEQRIRNLQNDESKHITYVIYGREKGESGTFHLQGFLQFDEEHPMSSMENGGPAGQLFQAHWSKARSILKARDYCKKEDPNPVELGKFRKRALKSGSRQGKRSDLDDFQNAVRSGGMTLRRAREEFPEVAAKYPRFCQEYISDYKEVANVEKKPMYAWQKALWEHLTKDPVSDREVVFVVDFKGNSGKTYFCKRFIEEFPETSQMLNPGKGTDMAYALDESINVLLVDCPRSRHDIFQYDFIEYVKNGYVFSTKYESRMKRLQPVHVVVFMNETPDETKLSRDRYNVIYVDERLLVPEPEQEPPQEPPQDQEGQREGENQPNQEPPEQQDQPPTGEEFLGSWVKLMEYTKMKSQERGQDPRRNGCAPYFTLPSY